MSPTAPPPAAPPQAGNRLLAGFRAALPRNVVALGVVSFLTDASSDMMMWTVPFYVALLGGGLVWVGLVEGIRESTASLVTVGSGWLSDRLGNRKVLVGLGYGISTLVKPVLALAAAPWQVLALLSLERVGKGIRGAPRDALVAGAVAPEHLGKAFSFHRLMDHAGASVGQVAGVVLALALFPHFRRLAEAGAGVVPADVFRWMYVIAAAPAALAVAAIVLFVRETAAEIKKKVQLDLAAAYDRRFWGLLVALLIFALGNSSDMFLLVRAGQVLGYSVNFTHAERQALAAEWNFPWQLPLMFFVLNVAKMVFTLPGGFLADRLGRTRLLLAGWIIYAGVYFAFGLAAEPWQAWALFAAYGLFYGFTEGVQKAVVADYVRPEVRGAAYGLAYFCEGIAKFPASLLLGIIYAAAGPAWAFGFGGGCAAAACAVLAASPRVLGGRPRDRAV
ncbi:MAG: MFS transporter [Planctomycetes bacterium]|nr:MFS transporter [Planctomycetota bacterium]